MFSIISFQANGERVEHLGQKASFFGLCYMGSIVEYYTSIEALKLGLASMKSVVDSSVQTVWDIKLAA